MEKHERINIAKGKKYVEDLEEERKKVKWDEEKRKNRKEIKKKRSTQTESIISLERKEQKNREECKATVMEIETKIK